MCYVQFIYEADLSKFSSILADLGMQLKTQLNWDQNCIFAELNELEVKCAMFDIAEFWVSDFESISYTFHDLKMLRIVGKLQSELRHSRNSAFLLVIFGDVEKSLNFLKKSQVAWWHFFFGG